MPHVRRVLALLLSVWFTVYIGEPQWLVPCPTHDAVPTASGTSASQGAMTHGAHHAGGAGHGHDASSPTHQCHCPGPCSGASAALAPIAPRVPVGALLAARLERVAPTSDHTPLGAPHTLPFANGPPTRLARAATFALALPV